MVDFSGAVSEAINLEEEAYYKDQEKQDQLFEDLLKVYDRGGIISCSIKVCFLSEGSASSSLYTRNRLTLYFVHSIRHHHMKLR